MLINKFSFFYFNFSKNAEFAMEFVIELFLVFVLVLLLVYTGVFNEFVFVLYKELVLVFVGEDTMSAIFMFYEEFSLLSSFS